MSENDPLVPDIVEQYGRALKNIMDADELSDIPDPIDAEPSSSEPNADVSEPDVDVPEPDVDVPEPDVSVSEPDVSVSEPDVSVSEPDVSEPSNTKENIDWENRHPNGPF